MSLEFAYSLLLMTTLLAMVSQALFRPLRLEHIFMALLCGSLAMVALQTLTTKSDGIYPYLFALGTCATCNVVWLLARALFRGSDSLELRHYCIAALIALLVLTNRSVDLLISMQWLESAGVEWLSRTISKVTQFLSSTVLALAFWESVRDFSKQSKSGQHQRAIFASAFFIGVFSCTVVAQGLLTETQSASVKPWLVAGSAIGIVLASWIVLLWQQRERDSVSHALNNPLSSESQEDKALIEQLEQLMSIDQQYLKHDLKMLDVAKELNTPEYKISRVIRTLTSAANFNQYVNRYRINHAKNLLVTNDAQRWTVLVIGLESGFASQASFNRAFKTEVGCTPNQYRTQHLNHGALASEPLTS